MDTKIGLKPESAFKMAESLNVLLADEYLLSLKTKNAHWNMEGADFYSKHLFFEQQYQQLDEVTDTIAEYIRSLGHYAPASARLFLQLTHLNEHEGEPNNGPGFIKALLADHESVIIHLREMDRLASEIHDSASNDFLTGLLKMHEKMAWMLRAQLN